MRYEEDFEKWAQHFRSMDQRRWERAQKYASTRAREARAEAFHQTIHWIIGRLRKFGAAALRPNSGMARAMSFTPHSAR